MAILTLTYQLATGDAIEVACQVDESYPDSCNEAKATAMSAFREACIIVRDLYPTVVEDE